MKSAIGKYAYYVHYYASNFEKQQRLPGKNDLSNYVIQRVANKTKKLTTKISKEVKQEYANTISAMYGRNINEESTKFKSSDYNFLIDTISKILDNQLNSFNSSIDIIEKYSGRVLDGKPQGDRVLKSRGEITTKQFLTQSQVNELNKYILDLTNEIQILQKTGTILPQKVIDLQKTLLSVSKKLQNIWENSKKQSLREWGKDYFGNSNRRFFGDADDSLRIRIDPSNINLNQLNNLIKECKIRDTVLKTAQGTLGEDISAVAADVVSGLGLKNINETIKKGVIGSNAPNIQYDLTGFTDMDKYVEFLLEDKNYKINNGRVLISKQASQQKIDVILTLPEELNLKSFRKIRGSVKSIDLKNDIGIVSGTNLWYLIQDEDRKNFLRPFLNIYADHSESTQRAFKNFGESFWKNEVLSYDKIKRLREDAYLAVKLISAYKALSGDTFGRSAAQLFIVNDVRKQKTYVLEINDIFSVILSQINKNKYSLDNFFNFDKITFNSFILDNSWQDTIAKRMGGVIQSAHEKKLTVSLKNTVLTSNLLGENKIIG